MENKEILFKTVVETVRTESNENVADRKLMLKASEIALDKIGMDSSKKYELADSVINKLRKENLLVLEETKGNIEKEVGRRKQEVYLIQYNKALNYLESTFKSSGGSTNITEREKKIRDVRVSLEKSGYSKAEVDEFLDDVIKDYETYAALVKSLRQEIADLKEELSNKPQASSTQQSSIEVTSSTPMTNFDILKRLNRLEKEVFGKQIVDNSEL